MDGRIAESKRVRDLSPIANRKIIHYVNSRASEVTDAVAVEYALTIYVNEKELATVVCTPEHMDELVLGFLASEGVIRSYAQVQDLQMSLYRGVARVSTHTDVNFNQEFYNKRYIASCCGKSRQTFYFYNDAHTAKHVSDAVTLSPEDILRLMAELDNDAKVFQQTGGVHMAALCFPDGKRISRYDIGRHNALDKLFGLVLQENLNLTGSVVTFSGRLSSEVLLKVAKIGVGIVLAKSAPTALALDMAEELGITAIGFVRGDSFNVYTESWRITR